MKSINIFQKICNTRYSTSALPKENIIDNTPTQLVYISRLSQQLNTHLLHQSDIQLTVNNIDFLICIDLKNKKDKIMIMKYLI